MGNSPNSSPKPHIETAKKSGVCQLCKLKLDHLPEELRQLRQLRNLDISQNKLDALPDWLNEFRELKGLIISNNRIARLPELGALKKLDTLAADHNCLTQLPASLSSLANLKTLTLSHNLLPALPLQLCQLRHLDVVDLSANRITHLPDDVSGLQAVELNLNQNQVSSLPESLARCPRLKVLRLEENCLPISAFSLPIMTQSQISLFAVEGNVFDMKTFHNVEGYDKYMERFTATKKKFN